MSQTEMLVAVALFVSTFVAWWYMTLPAYRDSARRNAAIRAWRERLKRMPSAIDYQVEVRSVEVYTPRPYTGNRFPGSVPSTTSIEMAEGSLSADADAGMPSFAAAPTGDLQTA